MQHFTIHFELCKIDPTHSKHHLIPAHPSDGEMIKHTHFPDLANIPKLATIEIESHRMTIVRAWADPRIRKPQLAYRPKTDGQLSASLNPRI